MGINVKEFVIDRVKERDLPQLMVIENSVFVSPWSIFTFLEELRHNRLAHYYCVRFQGQLVAYGGAWVVLDEIHITTIAIHPCYQGQGIGSLLLKKFFELARELKAKEITLEVRETNMPARHLYEKFGFKVMGARKNYYGDESALIMTATLEVDNDERQDTRY
ncbi:MAG: ribosomal protein S18-alanine N-acetyltransferase [Firmicutes bacterium]|nr:ribosomal protein S18-alanine N-acetyltransferase [Bacillota bacterium]